MLVQLCASRRGPQVMITDSLGIQGPDATSLFVALYIWPCFEVITMQMSCVYPVSQHEDCQHGIQELYESIRLRTRLEPDAVTESSNGKGRSFLGSKLNPVIGGCTIDRISRCLAIWEIPGLNGTG